jgi:hypothetical protein
VKNAFLQHTETETNRYGNEEYFIDINYTEPNGVFWSYIEEFHPGTHYTS